MRWSKLGECVRLCAEPRRQARENPKLIRPLLAFTVAILIASALLLFGAPEEKHVSIYSSAANYSLPVLERNGADYVGLLEVFEPLGAVNAKANGQRWRFRYYEVESEFMVGKTRARIRGTDIDLPGNFLLENGRGLVPLSSLGTLLPRILGGPVTFNQTARRLFIGNVAVHFTAQVSKTTPPKLVMNFTAPVNPMLATEPGKLRMVFTREALVAPGSEALTFDSKVIPSATFHENNGAAELVITASVPVKASFSNDGRTITVEPPTQPTVPAQPAQVAVQGQLTGAQTSPAVVTSPAQRYLVVVDPGHGGEERGAALADQLAEKDVTLELARHLRQELQARGFAVMLLRDNDATLTLDQRASLTNSAHPAIYISLHAASHGTGVRLYTAMVSAGAETRGPFLGWDTAQTSFEPISRAAAIGFAAELHNRQIPVRSLIAPLRPLNNVTTAAVAIEVAPPSDDVSQLNSPTYQQLVTTAVAAGVVDIRDKLEAGR